MLIRKVKCDSQSGYAHSYTETSEFSTIPEQSVHMNSLPNLKNYSNIVILLPLNVTSITNEK